MTLSVLHFLVLPGLAQQQCISLTGSSTCPAFNNSHIATNLTNLFPFLSNVTDTRSFDSQLAQYVNTTYAQQKFQSQNFFGCSNVNLANTSNLYARYTYSFICNALIQNSISTCRSTAEDTPPLCADACAQFALSEETIIASPDLCGRMGPNAVPQLHADWNNCGLPQNSINNTCIPGSQNEPNDCGFQYNLVGLCSYCSASSVNSTDYCCVTSRAEQRCSNVHLPTYSSMQPIFSTTAPPAPTSTSSHSPAAANGHGLSGGQIAGIVVGSVVGAGVLLALLICCCLLMRRRKGTDAKHSLNQPTPLIQREKSTRSNEFAAVPGARVTRMTAIEHDSNNSPSDAPEQPSSSQEQREVAAVGAPPTRGKREKSSSEGLEDSSPESQGYSSGEGGATGQSEQLDSFKDYYSNDEIHPGDVVATLWAYSPRANDEFELERGEMLRIVGIWDDGWATGVRVNQRAEQWEPERNAQRDSGLSGGTTQEPPPRNGDVKAFPLVCVCLPQHWRKTIEGDVQEPDLSDGLPTD